MTYVKYFIITFLIAVGLGFMLATAQQNKEYETAVEIKDKTSGEYVVFDELKIFPNKKQRYDERLTGKGRVIYDTDLFTLAYVTVTAEGYEKKRIIQFWNATKENVIFMEKLKEHPSKDEAKSEDERKDNDEKVKVDLLPKIKEK